MECTDRRNGRQVRVINLKELFGEQFKVGYEESYQAERGPNAWAEDPWLMVLECVHGHVYPHGGELLAVSTNHGTNSPVANQIRKMAATTVTQDGTDGVNAVFHIDDFDAVAKIVLPRKRRRLTDEQSVAAAAVLATASKSSMWKTAFAQGTCQQNELSD